MLYKSVLYSMLLSIPLFLSVPTGACEKIETSMGAASMQWMLKGVNNGMTFEEAAIPFSPEYASNLMNVNFLTKPEPMTVVKIGGMIFAGVGMGITAISHIFSISKTANESIKVTQEVLKSEEKKKLEQKEKNKIDEAVKVFERIKKLSPFQIQMLAIQEHHDNSKETFFRDRYASLLGRPLEEDDIALKRMASRVANC